MNKAVLTILAALSASVALADDFKTIDGKEYKDAKISRVEPDGLVLITKSGISKVYFSELPKDVQEKFHYDPQKAAEFTSQTVGQNRAFLQQRAEEEQKQAEERKKYWSENPMPSMASGRPILNDSALDQRPASAETWLVQGRVDQFVTGGIIVRTMNLGEAGPRQMPSNSYVYVAGTFDGFADGDLIKLLAKENGYYTGDSNRHLRAFTVQQLIRLGPAHW